MKSKKTFTLPLKVTGEYGLNRIYSGVHWSVRKRQAEYIHALVRSQIGGETPMQKPVALTFRYNSRLDLSNHSYLAKMIEDALKGVVIEDDSRRYVRGFYQEFWEGEGVQVEVEEID